jgi:hypothetical protein
MTTHNNTKNIINYFTCVTLSGKRNSPIDSVTELQFLVVTISKVTGRKCASLMLLRNVVCNVCFKYRPAQVNEIFVLYLLQNRVYACGKVLCRL